MLVSRAVAALLVGALVLPGCIKDPLGGQIQGRAVDYLVRAQNPDGGWPGAPNATSDFATTCWVVLALVSSDGPKDVLERAEARLADWSDNVSRNDTGSFSDSNAVVLYALAALALGVAEARLNGSDPLGRLEGYAANGSLALNEKIFVLGALGRGGRHASAQPLREEIRSLVDAGNGTELGTDGWYRSMGILALLANGEDPEAESSRLWARSLLPYQQEESGFFSRPEYGPDSSTTAAVLAVLTKVRFVYSSERTAATEFLGEMQQRDGWIRFSEEHDFGRAKTTAEAILGITGAGAFGVHA